MNAALPKQLPWLSQGKVAVLGTGSALPGAAVDTAALIAIMEQRFGLERGREARAVARRLGIRSRHICRSFDAAAEEARAGQSNPELCAQALRAALADAGLDAQDLGYLIGHTTTPVQLLPGNIAVVADHLNYGGPHLELRQACTGFANALMIAFGLMAMPGARPVAIVGSETGSLFFDPARAATNSGQLVNMVQMGDAAAAVIIGPGTTCTATVSGAWFGAIGLGRQPGLSLRQGQREFDHDFGAILAGGGMLFDAGRAAAEMQQCMLSDADIIVPHQANGTIGEMLAVHFEHPQDRFFVNAHKVGNTGSAAIWLALDELRKSQLSQGARVLALGAEATKFMYGGFVYDHA
jgi:3-oxoacyl-[acyl-carrier-protein] synthase III